MARKPQGAGASLKWKNGPGKREDYVSLAQRKVQERRSNSGPTRVFLLGQLFPTSFVKDSRGGMFHSKQYFDVSKLRAANAEALAEKLDGLAWSALAEAP